MQPRKPPVAPARRNSRNKRGRDLMGRGILISAGEGASDLRAVPRFPQSPLLAGSSAWLISWLTRHTTSEQAPSQSDKIQETPTFLLTAGLARLLQCRRDDTDCFLHGSFLRPRRSDAPTSSHKRPLGTHGPRSSMDGDPRNSRIRSVARRYPAFRHRGQWGRETRGCCLRRAGRSESGPSFGRGAKTVLGGCPSSFEPAGDNGVTFITRRIAAQTQALCPRSSWAAV